MIASFERVEKLLTNDISFPLKKYFTYHLKFSSVSCTNHHFMPIKIINNLTNTINIIEKNRMNSELYWLWKGKCPVKILGVAGLENSEAQYQ